MFRDASQPANNNKPTPTVRVTRFLIIVPLISRAERPRPLPNSITEAVLAKKAAGHHHEHDGIACACGHDHGSEEGHSHSGVGLDFQLTVLLPLSIACLVLAEAFSWVGGNKAVADVLGLVATAIAGGPIIWSAIKGLAKGQTNVNELVAMSIIGNAVASSDVRNSASRVAFPLMN